MRAESQIEKSKSLSPDDQKRRLRVRAERGFTFMELMIVMVIIAILSTVAIPRYLSHLRRAKEVVLLQDIWAMNRAIDFYTTDKEKPPASLEEVKSAGYLREIPKDPICPECPWTEVPAVSDSTDLNSVGGIGGVKSSAPGNDSSGKPFSEYGTNN